MNIINLNTDCLLRIFTYCTEDDLLNLCQAHPHLQNVIDMNIYQLQSLDLLMCGHRKCPDIMKRTLLPMTYADRIKIAKNWMNGCYREQQYFRRRKMFATKLHLEMDSLYLTLGSYLSQHKRLRTEALQPHCYREIYTDNKADISDFVKRYDTIFAGRITGNCFIHEDNYTTEQQLHNPREYLWRVNFFNNVYITSSDRCTKLWLKTKELDFVQLEPISERRHTFKALEFDTQGKIIFGGLYTSVNRKALMEIDLESGCEKVLNSSSISIYDLKVKDDNVIFTANFDTTFRLYDRRTDKDECVWEDPFDSSFYCLEHDGLYAVLCGTKYHSRVNLYDIRVAGKYMQLYFPQVQMKRRENPISSPVYSLACDSRYLFVATAHNLHVLDFKADYAAIRDYRNIFKESHRI